MTVTVTCAGQAETDEEVGELTTTVDEVVDVEGLGEGLGLGDGDGETELELLALLDRLGEEVVEVPVADPRTEDINEDVDDGDGRVEDVLLLGTVAEDTRELLEGEELGTELPVDDWAVEVGAELLAEDRALLVGD